MSKRPRFDMAPALPFYPQRPGEKDCVFYMRTRTCSFGANCKYDHPAWVPAGGIPDWKEVSTTATKTQPLPVRSGEPDCAFYLKTGICKFGSKCKFNHPEDKSTAATKNKSDESTDGNLKAEVNVIDTTTKIITPVLNGDVEGGSAAAKPVATFNAKGLPVRPGETECSFYMKTGSCKFGSACRFDHPEKPASVALQQSQTKVAPLLGGFSGGYGNFSIFPGALPDYGLGVLGSDFGLPSLAQAPIYPQRPGEATCSYYMKTGICKFGSSCKFHHPVNRKEAEPVVKLTLAGFPRREGEQPCPFYMKTGTCKYAFSCKFDHPPPGEAAAKAVAEAGKSEQPEVGEVVPIS